MDKNKLAEKIHKLVNERLKLTETTSGDQCIVDAPSYREITDFVLNAALAELSKSGEFREFKVFSHNEPHRGYLTVEPLFKLNIPFKNEMLAHVIEITALQAANAKIQELQEQLSKSKNVVTPEENELASLRNFKDFFQPRMTELKSKLTHETNMASNYCEIANKQAGEILQLTDKIKELEQKVKELDAIKKRDQQEVDVLYAANYANLKESANRTEQLQAANAKIQELEQKSAPQSVESVSIKRLRDKITELEEQLEALKAAHSISMPKPLYDSIKAKNEVLEQQLKEADSVIEFYASWKSWDIQDRGCNDGMPYDIIRHNDFSDVEYIEADGEKYKNVFGGKRARQYLKSRGE